MLFTKQLSDLKHSDIIEFCSKWDENIRVEYKPNMKTARKNISKIVSSFANYQGGVLIIGLKSKDGKAVFPINGFKPSKEELRVTIQQICLHDINPPLMPDIEVIETSGHKVIVVVDVHESMEAPHAIENSKKVYFRTGAFSEPCEIADIDYIDYLLKRRNKAINTKQSYLNEVNQRFKEEYIYAAKSGKASLGLPLMEITICPSLPYNPLCGLNQTYNFARNYANYDWNPFRNLNHYRRISTGIISFFGDGKHYRYSELSNLGVITLKKTMGNTATEPSDNYTINFFRIIISLANLLRFSQSFYQEVNFGGTITIGLTLNNIKRYKFVFPWDSGIPDDPDDFISYEDNIYREVQYVNLNLDVEFVEIMTSLIRDYVWGFTQKFQSISDDNLKKNIAYILAKNNYIASKPE